MVERPASIVKELIENSIDAEAREIEVRTEAGGVDLVWVRDDGGGIHSDDLPLALQRHATSKIGDAGDLIGIDSLGFRGEALASVASVAKVKLSSATSSEAGGWFVESHGGETQGSGPVAHPQGTTVEVRDLFYNTPARRKFLKSERSEIGQIDQILRRLSLAHMDIGFSLAQARTTGSSARVNRPLRLAPGDPADRLSGFSVQILWKTRSTLTSLITICVCSAGWVCPITIGGKWISNIFTSTAALFATSWWATRSVRHTAM